MDFGEYLRTLRLKRGLSIRQLAANSRVSNAYISQLERGQRGLPSPEILMRLAPPLGVDYTELMVVCGYLKPQVTTGRRAREKASRYGKKDRGTQAFANRLLRRMQQKGMDRAELARATGLKASQIQAYESGKLPGPAELCALAEALGCTTDYLLGRGRDELWDLLEQVSNMGPAARASAESYLRWVVERERGRGQENQGQPEGDNHP